MKKLKLYIETSVWNFLFAEEAPEKQQEKIEVGEAIGCGTRRIIA